MPHPLLWPQNVIRDQRAVAAQFPRWAPLERLEDMNWVNRMLVAVGLPPQYLTR